MTPLLDLSFWAAGSLIVYTYAGYPAICLAAGLVFRRRVNACEFYPTVSIIIACYNEEKNIRQKLENTLALTYPKDKIQILVASESTDSTDAIVREYASRGVSLCAYAERRGKTVMLYDTVPKATGEILVFSDANVRLTHEALARLSAYFCDAKIGAVTARLIVSNPKESDVSWGEHVYRRYETFLRRQNSLRGAVLNPDGALFAIRRALWKPISPARGDDFELVVRVLLQGYWSIFADDALSYEDASVLTAAEISRKIRMVSWFTASTFILLGEMIRLGRISLMIQIISHKLLRWFTPYFFFVLYVSNMMLAPRSAAYLVFFIVQSIGYAMGVAGWYLAEAHKKKPPLLLKAAHYFLLYNYAFLIGTIRGLIPGMTSSAWGKVRE